MKNMKQIRLVLVFLGFFLLNVNYLSAQLIHPELNFLLGDFETRVLLPDGQGGWVAGGSGKARFYPILDGTFIREDLNLSFGKGTLTMSNSMGKDRRSDKLRMVAMDKEFSTMDVYYGKVEDTKVILDNIDSDLPFKTQDGKQISFRLTYSKISENENESFVEMTKDQGQTWLPYSKQRFIRVKDSEQAAIKTVILGYISAFLANDYTQMEKYLHPSLSKRGLSQAGQLSANYSKSDLQNIIRQKEALPKAQQKNYIEGVKVEGQVASAVLQTGNAQARWKEYIHLAKLEDRWLIIDIFWSFQ